MEIHSSPRSTESFSGLALKYGLIIAGINIIWGLLAYLVGAEGKISFINSILGLGVTILSVWFLVQAIKERKTMQNGILKIIDGVKTGAMTSLIAASAYGIYLYYYLTKVNPNLYNEAKETSLQNMDDEMIEEMSGLIDTILSPGFITMLSVGSYIIGGIILSVGIAAYYKSDTQNNFPEEVV